MKELELPLNIMGAPGSPYTRKMLSLLRYRRIPYRFIPSNRHRDPESEARYPERPKPKVHLLPIFYLKNESGMEEAVCDSTPLIRTFEQTLKNYRSVVPDESALAFIDYLIEDYADEWITKAMFHYRWSYSADIKKAGDMLPRWNNTTTPDAVIRDRSEEIANLQISRLRYVGSNEVTRKTIEKSFARFLHLLNAHLENFPFMLGGRPSACDFAIYGQLTCLALFDPTPQALIVENVPRVYAWTESLEDLSGYETLKTDWIDSVALPPTLVSFLNEIGKIYGPYLHANAEAHASRATEFTTTLSGRPWTQQTFNYHVKCLDNIHKNFETLEPSVQESLLAQCDHDFSSFLKP